MTIENMAAANQALKPFMSLKETTNWTFSLEQMAEFMKALGNPQEKLTIIHVAGTSGKTSTAYYIADMLRRSGKKIGLTVSPHVDSVNERVQLDGQPLPEADFCRLLGEFIDLPAVKAANPSYFGLMIGFAFWVFAKQAVDYAVIEVGLGGRLDTTNIIQRSNKVCVITDIGLDHTRMLGDTLEAIAGEKAGIIQAGNHVVVAEQATSILAVINDRVSEVGADLNVLQIDLNQAPQILPLFQQRNWLVAKAAVDYVASRDGFTPAKPEGSTNLLIPARMETFHYKGKTVIIDGAHNAQKFQALCASIQQKYPNQTLPAIVSITHGKDESTQDKMAALKPIVEHLIITTFHGEQDAPKWSVDPVGVQSAAQEVGYNSVEIIMEPEAAFTALMARPEPVVLVTGSFYLLNHIRPALRGAK